MRHYLEVIEKIKEEMDATIHLAGETDGGLGYVDGLMKAIAILRNHQPAGVEAAEYARWKYGEGYQGGAMSPNAKPPKGGSSVMKPVPVNKDGWSRWQEPVMQGYLMQCCDCGLVHEMEFKVIKVDVKKKNGWWEGEEQDSTKYRVSLRARRPNLQIDPDEQLGRVSDEAIRKCNFALNFFKSVILAGERWSTVCQAAFDDAKAALQQQPPQVVAGGEELDREELSDAFYAGFNDLPENVKNRLSIYQLREIYECMVAPALAAHSSKHLIHKE